MNFSVPGLVDSCVGSVEVELFTPIKLPDFDSSVSSIPNFSHEAFQFLDSNILKGGRGTSEHVIDVVSIFRENTRHTYALSLYTSSIWMGYL